MGNRILFFIIMLCTIHLTYGQITHSETFTTGKLRLDSIVADGELYLRPQYIEAEPTGEPGEPELPVKYITVSVPYNATNFTVNAQALNPQTLQLQHRVYPAQTPRITSDTSPEAFTEPDPAIYSADSFFPQKTAEIVNEGFYDGCNHVITVAIYPLRFNPVRRQLQLIRQINLTVNFTLTGINTMPVKPVIKNVRTNESFEYVRSLVVNPNQVETFAPAAILNAPPYGIMNAYTYYEYVIVTAEELIPAFDIFIAWKRQKGYNVHIEAIEYILADPRFANGDEISGINDDAGKLRAYLKYYYENHGTRFVLLSGDYTNMPIRMGYGKVNDTYYGEIPTNLYFSDFNGSWNFNNNEKYGEFQEDGIDYFSEICVGRLLCSTSEHIENYTEKLIKYELNPGNGDYSYLKKIFMFQNDEIQNNNGAELLKSEFSVIFNNDSITVFGENPSCNDLNPTFPSGNDIITEMNKRYGYFSMMGHGNRSLISVLSEGINKRTLSRIYAIYNGDVSNGDNGLNYLTNEDYPAIAYSIACSITPFDMSITNNHNMGSSFTVASLYGGPALLGNTRYGWSITSPILERKFVSILSNNLMSKKIGKIQNTSKELFSSTGKYRHWVTLSHNLIGEPEFEMWTDIPTKFSNVNVSRTNNTVSVSCADTDSCYFSITDSNGRPSVLYSSGSATFPYADPNSVIMVYKHNYIPYIAPLYLQNATLEESRYIIADNVYIGSAVDSGRTAGDYIIGENGELTIEASGDVVLQDGLVVDSGGTVYIKTKGNVVLSGGVVMPGGVLAIDASSVSVTSGLIVKKGGILDIKK